MDSSQDFPELETVTHALELINNRAKWDGSDSTGWSSLDELLQDGILWSAIVSNRIIPKNALRCFTKSIKDKEVRLNVMKFLHEYVKYYFFDNACDMAQDDYQRRGWTISRQDVENEADKYISDFQMELGTQISQIEKTGEFSGDKFNKLQTINKALEKEVRELKEKINELETHIDRYEHPADYGMGLNDEFKTEEFKIIMDVLARNKVVRVFASQTPYGTMPCCYYWDKGMGLFGYFVDKVSEELDMRYSDDRINWKPFKKAFLNFDKLEKEARNTITRCKKKTKKFPDDGDLVMNAIKFARQEAKKLEKL